MARQFMEAFCKIIYGLCESITFTMRAWELLLQVRSSENLKRHLFNLWSDRLGEGVLLRRVAPLLERRALLPR
jgi:hypothetical protein